MGAWTAGWGARGAASTAEIFPLVFRESGSHWAVDWAKDKAQAALGFFKSRATHLFVSFFLAAAYKGQGYVRQREINKNTTCNNKRDKKYNNT